MQQLTKPQENLLGAARMAASSKLVTKSYLENLNAVAPYLTQVEVVQNLIKIRNLIEQSLIAKIHRKP